MSHVGFRFALAWFVMFLTLRPGRADADPGADGEEREHQRPPGQRL